MWWNKRVSVHLKHDKKKSVMHKMDKMCALKICIPNPMTMRCLSLFIDSTPSDWYLQEKDVLLDQSK